MSHVGKAKVAHSFLENSEANLVSNEEVVRPIAFINMSLQGWDIMIAGKAILTTDGKVKIMLRTRMTYPTIIP